MSGLLLYCRAGFEHDLSNEIQHRALQLGAYGYVQSTANSGYVLYHCHQPQDAERLVRELNFDELVFARQMIVFTAHLNALDSQDRVSEIVAACEGLPRCSDLFVEYADTTHGRELSKFCKKIAVPLRQALRKTAQLDPKPSLKGPVMHLFFHTGTDVLVGYSVAGNRSQWPLGILRLKFPQQAPSRSTLKLEEAIHLFLTPQQQKDWFTAGSHAVDLGACPGGWTYQLVSRGLFVQAVDNGAMAQSLMDSGQVRHYPQDGFKYRPAKKNVQWLVCDMIEKPDKVARLMANWLARGDCQRVIFNLKLPMKRRFESYLQARDIIAAELADSGRPYQLKAKHLYHDREEISLYLGWA